MNILVSKCFTSPFFGSNRSSSSSNVRLSHESLKLWSVILSSESMLIFKSTIVAMKLIAFKYFVLFLEHSNIYRGWSILYKKIFTFHDKFVQIESESERSWKFSILHAEKHRNQCHSAGLRLTQISVLVEFEAVWSVWFLTWQISFPDIPIKVHILSRNWTATFIDKRWSGCGGTK